MVYVDGGIYPPRLCLGQQHSLWDSGIRNDDSMIIHKLHHKLTIYFHGDDMDYPSRAVCYDSMCLISLIWTMTSWSYDGDGTVNRTGHDGGYDCSPAGILACLPRCLCLPWVMDGMTQFLTKINRPYSDMMLSKTMYGGGRRGVCTSDTPPEACSAAGFPLALIGRRASVGGSVGLCGVWIEFIRQALEDSQSIVAAPVTGHLFLLPCSAAGTPFELIDLRYIA